MTAKLAALPDQDPIGWFRSPRASVSETLRLLKGRKSMRTKRRRKRLRLQVSRDYLLCPCLLLLQPTRIRFSGELLPPSSPPLLLLASCDGVLVLPHRCSSIHHHAHSGRLIPRPISEAFLILLLLPRLLLSGDDHLVDLSVCPAPSVPGRLAISPASSDAGLRGSCQRSATSGSVHSASTYSRRKRIRSLSSSRSGQCRREGGG